MKLSLILENAYELPCKAEIATCPPTITSPAKTHESYGPGELCRPEAELILSSEPQLLKTPTRRAKPAAQVFVGWVFLPFSGSTGRALVCGKQTLPEGGRARSGVQSSGECVSLHPVSNLANDFKG